MDSAAQLREWRQLAARAARRAGDYLSSQSAIAGRVLSADGRDLKIAADREAQELIASLLHPSGLDFLGEEQDHFAFADDDRLRWIVDPLDGSVNFHRRIPLFCVSIGLWRGSEPILGCILDVSRFELFEGVVGHGSWLNSSPIRVSSSRDRSQAIVATGFPVSTDYSHDALLRFVALVSDYKKVRLFGSAALSLAYVAAGRVDAYVERDIKLWDVGAGLAIVTAAGGVIVRRPTEVCGAYNVSAAASLEVAPKDSHD